MKIKNYLFVIVATVFIGCSQKTASNEVLPGEELGAQSGELKQVTADVTLTFEAQVQAASWMSFSTWQQHIRLLKQGDDLFFNNENASIVEFFTDFENAIPASLASTGLSGRFKVVKSCAFTFKEALALFGPNDSKTSAAKEALLNSHNNLLQFINQTVEKNALPDFNKPTN